MSPPVAIAVTGSVRGSNSLHSRLGWFSYRVPHRVEVRPSCGVLAFRGISPYNPKYNDCNTRSIEG